MANIPFLNNAYFAAKVGIGTISPDSKLSVTSTTLNSEDIIYLKSGADNVNDYLGIAWELGVGGNGPHSAIRSFAGPSGSDARLGFLTTSDGGTTLTEGLSVAHDGNVGIGTTTPGATLQIGKGVANVLQKIHGSGTAGIQIFTGGGAGTKIAFLEQHFSDEGTLGLKHAGTTKIHLRANGNSYLNNGNVGIGTTSPSAKLDVVGKINQTTSSGGTAASFTNSDATSGYGVAIQSEGTSNTRYALILRNLDSSNVYGGVSTMTNQVGFWGIGASPTGTLGSRLTVGGNASVGSGYTSNSAPTNGLIVEGNVGIGTISPGYPLEVKSASPFVTTNSTGTGNSGFAMLVNAGSNGVGVIATDNGGSLTFDNGATGSAQSEKMRITSAGNVGIGTTSPASLLHIQGSTYHRVETFFDGSYTSGWKFSDLNGGIKYDAGSDNLVVFSNFTGTGAKMTFETQGSEKMRITSGGDVGIGTTAPTAPLDVFGVRAGRNWSINNRATIRLDANGTGYPSDILFGHTAAANQTSWTGAYWSLSSRGSSDGNKFHFYRASGNPTVSSEAILMTFDPNLRVGINNSSPSTTLDVTGTGNFTGLVSGITPVAAANFVTKAYVDGSGGGTGPFLPLAGGTLSGTLNITQTTSDFIDLTRDLATDQTWRQAISGAGSFSLYDVTRGADVFTLDTSGDATFAGDVTATANYSAGNSKIIYKAQRSGGAVAGDWSYDDATTDMSLGTSTAHSFSLKTGNTRALTINSSQNATFAGGVVSNAIVQANGFRTTTGSTDYSLLTRNSSNTAVYIQQAGSGNILDVRYGSQAAGQGTSAFAVNSSGNVGIGTTSPRGKLDIVGNTDNDSDFLTIQDDDASAGSHRPSIRFRSNTAQIGQIVGLNGSMRFSSGTTENSMLEILDNGNVGIGTTSPDNRLDVVASDVNITPNAESSAVFRRNGNNYLTILSNASNEGGILFGNAVDDNDGSVSYKHNTQSMQFATADVERMRITSTGNVGIGDASPTSISANTFSLSVNSSRSDLSGALISKANGTVKHQQYWDSSGYSFNLSANSGNFQFNGGNVGIGTTSPGAKLNVVGTGTQLGTSGYYYNTFLKDTTNSGVLLGGNNTDNGVGFLAGVNELAFLTFGTSWGERMRINSAGNVGIGTINPAQDFVVADATNGNGVELVPGTTATIQTYNRGTSAYTNLNIDTLETRVRSIGTTIFNNGSGFSESMRITSAGNVGIGTTSPLGRLQVNEYTVASQGNQSMHGEVSVFANDGDESLFLGLKDSAYPNRGWAINPVAYGINSSLQIKEHGSTAVRMTIQSGGNVGIGATSPVQKLHIVDTDGANIILNSNTGAENNGIWMTEGGIATPYVNGAYVHYDSTNNIFKINTGTASLATRFEIARDTGAIKFNNYNSTNNTGTPTYLLGTDASGNIVKTNTVPGSGAGPYLPLSAGSSYPLTGTLHGTSTNFSGNGDYAGSMTLGTGASTAEASLTIGQGRTDSGYSYIDLVGGTTYSDYGLRIIRGNTGSNAESSIIHRGQGNLNIQTTDSASILLKTAGNEKMRITSAGNVGIGTTSPSSTLTVDGEVEILSDDTSGANEGGHLTLRASSAGTKRWNIDNYADSDLRFFTQDDATAANGDVKMIILDSGKVGIGTTSPTYTLDVVSAGDGLLSLTGATKPVMRFMVGTSTVGTIQAQENTSMNVSAYGTSSLNLQTAGTAPRLTILTGGNIGIGTETPGSLLEIEGTTNSSTSNLLRLSRALQGSSPEKVAGFYSGTSGERGYITVSNFATAYNTSSDYRLKENIKPIDNSVERLMSLKPCNFNFISEDEDKVVMDGFIAHEAKDIVPEAVTGIKDAVDEKGNPMYQGIDQSKLVPLLTAALQEALQRIEILEQKINN